ncbi:MAG TPA: protein kinase [Streptosporangiaceae bacterium]|nr:protein kinase [Streptosporangiaceae bacterium]
MDPLQPGDPASVGSYRLLGRLGAGGMGQVFLGVSPGGRKVAVKVIHPVHAGTARFRERFAREIEAARRVGGFHTAPVVDADPHANPPWMVTAFIDGPSLQDAVDGRGPLRPDQVWALGAGLAEGLAAIHARGLVHRDLKPGNVILAPDGPRIIDFGIARVIDASTPITNPGAVIGTFAYMSPEQVGGDATSPASDVFSLGSVLAFAATGRPPFAADSAVAVMFRLVNRPPDLVGPADPRLARLIGGCLAKAPEARPTVSYLLAAFARPGPEPWLATAPGDARPGSEPLLATAPGDARPGAAVGGAPTTTPPQTPPPTGPERQALPLLPLPFATAASEAEPRLPQARHALPSAATSRPRRWPAALIAAAVLVAALAITLPFVLSAGTPQAAAGNRSGAATASAGGLASPATVAGAPASPDRSRRSTTGGRNSQTPQANASSIAVTLSPPEHSSHSPASSGSSASSGSTAGSGSTASSGSPELVEVPDVVGLTADQAIKALENAGFTVVVIDPTSGTFRPGRVTGYTPSGEAPLGSQVTIRL